MMRYAIAFAVSMVFAVAAGLIAGNVLVMRGWW